MTTKTQETRTRLFVVTLALALGLFGKAFGQLARGPQQFLQSDPLAADGPAGSGTVTVATQTKDLLDRVKLPGVPNEAKAAKVERSGRASEYRTNLPAWQLPHEVNT